MELEGLQMKKPYSSQMFIFRLQFSVRIFGWIIKFRQQLNLLILPMLHFAGHAIFLLNAFFEQLTFLVFVEFLCC